MFSRGVALEARLVNGLKRLDELLPTAKEIQRQAAIKEAGLGRARHQQNDPAGHTGLTWVNGFEWARSEPARRWARGSRR